MPFRVSCVATTIRWADRMSLPLVCRYLDSGDVFSNIQRNILTVSIVSYRRRASVNPLVFTRTVVFMLACPYMADSVRSTSTLRPWSGFPKDPKTFFKALSLAHQHVSPHGARRLCRVSWLFFSHTSILW